jgi:hypothetical protein
VSFFKKLFTRKPYEPTEEEVRQLKAARTRVLGMKKPSCIAKLSPGLDQRLSRMDGGFLAAPGESWPTGTDGPMIPLLQIAVDELCAAHDAFTGLKLVTVWGGMRDMGDGPNNGDGWALREYSSLDGLEPLPDIRKKPGKPHSVDWKLSDDFPHFWDLEEEGWGDYVGDKIMEEFEPAGGTKIGGWPDLVQSALERPGFVMQIDSEAALGWNFGDGGVLYFTRDSSGWHLEIQMY